MKLKYEFQTVEVAGEKIAVPLIHDGDTFHGALRVNEVASAILDLLKNDTTEDAMIDSLLTEYRASCEEIAKSVHKIVEKLRKAELLVE